MTDPEFCIENYFSPRVFNLKGEVILTKKKIIQMANSCNTSTESEDCRITYCI